MADLYHFIGSDLQISSNGNFVIATDETEGQQRVLRRLLTNPENYNWHLEYGAGLAQFLGKPMSQAHITARISSQMLLEKAVLQIPQPVINVQASDDNVIIASIHYVDAQSQNTSDLDFETGG